MIPVMMPQVGHDIPTGTIVEWLKKENDPVERGEVILVVESEKAAFEIEAEASGILLKILHTEGEEVEVYFRLALEKIVESVELRALHEAVELAVGPVFAFHRILLKRRRDRFVLSAGFS